MDYLKCDFRGHCQKLRCIYNDRGKCDMWDDISIPEDVNNCNNYEEN